MKLNKQEAHSMNLFESCYVDPKKDDQWESALSWSSPTDPLQELEEFLATPTQAPERNKTKSSTFEINRCLLLDFEDEQKCYENCIINCSLEDLSSPWSPISLSSSISRDSDYGIDQVKRCLLDEYEDDEYDPMAFTLDSVHALHLSHINEICDHFSWEEMERVKDHDSSIQNHLYGSNNKKYFHVSTALEGITLLDLSSSDAYINLECTSDPNVYVGNLLNLSFLSHIM